MRRTKKPLCDVGRCKKGRGSWQEMKDSSAHLSPILPGFPRSIASGELGFLQAITAITKNLAKHTTYNAQLRNRPVFPACVRSPLFGSTCSTMASCSSAKMQLGYPAPGEFRVLGAWLASSSCTKQRLNVEQLSRSGMTCFNGHGFCRRAGWFQSEGQ